ncbi:MAG: NB-ARC domain-containing protein [Pseudonocardiales bacterium]|nr:NB-ARC domain-containing protein [Pseudonocardiales bacterium]
MPRQARELRPHESARAFFGAELRHWRLRRNYSQDDLGRLTLHSGDLIAKVEKAVRWPTEPLAQRCDLVLDTGGELCRLLPLVLSERPSGGDGSAARPASWLPALDAGTVARPAEQDALVDAVLAAGASPQPRTVLLTGPGGFGKTTLALRGCHDGRITASFDSVLWVELGPECDDARVLHLVGDLCERLGGERPGLSTVDQAGFRLAEALGDHRALLVLDNVWTARALAPFLLGGTRTVRLVTTRDVGVGRATAGTIALGPMTDAQTAQLIADSSPMPLDGQDGLPALAAACSGWPLLASVVAGTVARDLLGGASEAVALSRALTAVRDEGPEVFDADDAGRREGTIGRVMMGSLGHLDGNVTLRGTSGLADRYLDLAVFPPAVPIPVPVLAAWWEAEHGWTATGVRQFARALADRSLLDAYDAAADTLVLHDVFRACLTSRSRRNLQDVHKSLVTAVRPLAAGGWHELDPAHAYLWHHLSHHLQYAGFEQEVVELLSNPRYLIAKLHSFGPTAFAGDTAALAAVRERGGTAVAVAETLLHAVHLVDGAGPAADTAATMLVALGRSGLLDPARAAELRTFTDRGFDLRWSRLAEDSGDGHTGAVTSVAVTANRVVSGGEDGTVRVWDRRSGRLVRVLRGNHGWVHAVAVSSDGDFVAAAGDDRVVRLWRLSSGAPLGALAGHSRRVRSLVPLPGGRELGSAGEDGAVVVWSVRERAKRRDLTTTGRPVWSIAVDATGTLLATGGEDEAVQLYDVDSGALLAEEGGHTDWVRAVAFAADAPLLASGSGDGSVCLWSATRSSLTLLRRTPTGQRVRSVAVSPDGGVATAAGEDAEVHLVTAASTAVRAALPPTVDWIRSLAVDDGETILGCEDGGVRRLRDDQAWAAGPLELSAGRGTVWSTAFSPSGDLGFLGHHDGTVEVVRAQDGGTVSSFRGGTGRVWSVASTDQVLVAAGGDGAVRMWDIGAGSLTATLTSEAGRAWAVAIDAAGESVAIASGRGTLSVWDVGTQEWRWRTSAHTGRTRSIAFGPDGRTLVTGGADGFTRVWDVATGSPVSARASGTSWVRSVALDRTGARTASGLGSGDITVGALDDDGAATHLFGHTGRILALEFVGGDRLVSAAADGTIRLWSVDGQHQLALVRVDASLQCAAVHPSTGSVLAGSSAGVVALDVRHEQE